MTKNATRILNPLPGGMQYTTRAKYFIALGLAYMVGDQLRFTDVNQGKKESQERDVCYWNGSGHPGKMHRPGEVRS